MEHGLRVRGRFRRELLPQAQGYHKGIRPVGQTGTCRGAHQHAETKPQEGGLVSFSLALGQPHGCIKVQVSA